MVEQYKKSNPDEENPFDILGPKKDSAVSEKDKNKDKAVSFSNVGIRAYSRTVGDNPAVSSGPALDLSWHYSKEESLPIDEFESSRDNQRRPRNQLFMQRFEREILLKHECEICPQEIARNIRSINRSKAQRMQTLHNLKFAQVEELWQKIQRGTARCVGVRKTTKQQIKILWKSATEKNAAVSSSSSLASALTTSLPHKSTRITNSDDDASVASVAERKISLLKKIKRKQKSRRHMKKSQRRRRRRSTSDHLMDDSRHILKYDLRLKDEEPTSGNDLSGDSDIMGGQQQRMLVSGSEASPPRQVELGGMSESDGYVDISEDDDDDDDDASSFHSVPLFLSKRNADHIPLFPRRHKYVDHDDSTRTTQTFASSDSDFLASSSPLMERRQLRAKLPLILALE
mmetsp:Transcript_12873/g.18790  ORF Transcript_12873/g.18790 Transcript_12873/m.18790 type:complete len:401 (+) Transcript_12873:119-1321(+)|eukprot:CAMPEP_0197247566 /NCGR_PEP_ID=MMETSP1429-20130617/29274_1 /TAXON_ID=49237 /ORGANISM="Chaetoceros  sp., Strain UNC1202" /LENGTH=400 /DNA_ID=CAMNT_0042708501 /DNA_START=119 /DNA_END=1321 /DNA_ORIENTATION=-